jgi:hypothetical protein
MEYWIKVWYKSGEEKTYIYDNLLELIVKVNEVDELGLNFETCDF